MKEQSIHMELSTVSKEKPQADQLQFGRIFTDHMFVMDYSATKGWHNAAIVPYQPITIDPSAMVFHYAQSVFEGLKAFRTADNEIQLFRPKKNLERLNRSSSRLVIPEIDEEFVLKGIKKLIEVDKDWVPDQEGTSLYIRPFIIATEPFIGVSPSTSYKFLTILSPVGSYYKEGINPVKIAVENDYTRAVKGGTGEAKTGGNYASGLKAQEIVTADGFSQVLWLDGIEKKYIEEVGSMNVFFKINGEVVTPQLNGSILPGVTRDSVIELLRHWDIPVSERRISMEELAEAHEAGLLEEAFGSGTAAVISPIGMLSWQGKQYTINDGLTGELSKKIYDTITGIQYGKIVDPFGWIESITEKETVN